MPASSCFVANHTTDDIPHTLIYKRKLDAAILAMLRVRLFAEAGTLIPSYVDQLQTPQRITMKTVQHFENIIGTARKHRLKIGVGAVVAVLVLVLVLAKGHTTTDRFNAADLARGQEAEKIAAEYVPQPTTPAKRAWFGRDINKASCLQSGSPAEKIREIQSFGQYASTNDLTGGVVEVERPLNGGRSEVWTFFPTMAQCEASLPRNQGISSKYE